jgi:hypothetical protein
VLTLYFAKCRFHFGFVLQGGYGRGDNTLVGEPGRPLLAEPYVLGRWVANELCNCPRGGSKCYHILIPSILDQICQAVRLAL